MSLQRYTVIERLDAGGMAEVFKGKATTIQGIEKLVAIKRILPSLTRNKKFVAMFLDEARLSMSLNHANIVQVFDVGVADNTYFIVMEYVDGTNLKVVQDSLARAGARIPTAQAIFITMEVCRALAYAHAKKDIEGRPLNIVHRDISPPNIMLSKEGEVKITDFGLAKAQSQIETTEPGVVKGKFSYLSPEAAYGEEVDHRTDIFSTGIVLWEMLAGRRLFKGKNDLETVELIRECQVPGLAQFNPEVTPELEQVVLKALARTPDDRYQSAQEFGDALAGYIFSRGLKVTSFDIQQLVGKVLSGSFGVVRPPPKPLSLIDRLIQGELERFRSLEEASRSNGRGRDDDPDEDYDGSEPLSLQDLSLGQYVPDVAGPGLDEDDRTVVDPYGDFRPPPGQEPVPERPGVPGPSHPEGSGGELARRMSGTVGRTPPPPPPRAPQGGSRKAWWLAVSVLVIVILAAAGLGLSLLLIQRPGG